MHANRHHSFLWFWFAVWALIVLIARAILDLLKELWPLILFLILFMYACKYVAAHPKPRQQSFHLSYRKSFHPATDPLFEFFDGAQPLPNPKPEDCIIVPLDNPKGMERTDPIIMT